MMVVQPCVCRQRTAATNSEVLIKVKSGDLGVLWFLSGTIPDGVDALETRCENAWKARERGDVGGSSARRRPCKWLRDRPQTSLEGVLAEALGVLKGC